MLPRTSPLFGEMILFLTPKCLLRYCRLLICSDSPLFCLRKSLGLYNMLIFDRRMIAKTVFKNILEGNRIESEPFFSLEKNLIFGKNIPKPSAGDLHVLWSEQTPAVYHISTFDRDQFLFTKQRLHLRRVDKWST